MSILNQHLTQEPNLLQHTLNNFFTYREYQFDEITSPQQDMDDIRQGKIQGVLIHNVYKKDLLNEVVEKLEQHNPAFLKTYFPEVFRSWFYGRNLNLCDADLTHYFRESNKFHHDLAQLIPGELGLINHLSSLLSKLGNGRNVVAPKGPNNGQYYMFNTLRGHDIGGYISAHCDNEFALRPSYRHLLTLCDPHIMSYVLAFSEAESGGETEFYNYQQPALGTEIMSDDYHYTKPDVSKLESAKLRIPAGSLMLFDSGRYLHALKPVEGNRKRWTATSFMALSKGHSKFYCWG